MIDTGDLRKGLTLDMNGELLKVVDYQHIKQGRGSAIVRLTLRNIRSGSTTQQTFQNGAKFTPVRVERQRVQYLYSDDGQYNFMDLDSFEQFALNEDQLGDALSYLIENMTLDLLTYQSEPIDVELPITVELKVAQTEPGVRGDTASGGTKPARLETGVSVNVPLFINDGDVVKVDTRTGQYLERVS